MTSAPGRGIFRLRTRLAAVLGRLGTKAAQRWTLLVATILAATSVGPHRVLDDFVLSLIARGEGASLGLHRGRLDLFTFTTGDPANNRELMETGLMLPWWTDPGLRISFFRPLSALSHRVDEWLFPGSAILMHLHSLAWFAALLGVVLLVYRRLEPRASLTGLSFALYALDDAHGPTLAWLANRNALIATFFGCLSLLAHHAYRGERRASGAVLGPLFLLLGLLAGEAAVGVLGYLVAYAAFRDGGTPRARVLSLVPYGAVVVLWRLSWSAGGFGARGSGAYIDPVGDPLGFLSVLPAKLVVMFHGQFSAPPSDLVFLAPPPHQPFLVALAGLTVLVVGWVLLPVVRRDGSAWFWAAGMVLSLLPLAATFPSDRLLSFVGLGAMPLLARLFEAFFEGGDAGFSVLRSLVVWGLFALHLLVAPLALPFRAAQMEIFGVAHDRAAAAIPETADIEGKTVVVVAAPTVLFANYIQAERAVLGIPRPRHLYVLTSASSAIDVERSGEHALTLRPERGFLYTPLDRHYRAASPFRVGSAVTLAGLTAEVTALGDEGRPASVRFTFSDPPDDYRFVTFVNGRFVPFPLPAKGEHASLPEEDFGQILSKTLLGAYGTAGAARDGARSAGVW